MGTETKVQNLVGRPNEENKKAARIMKVVLFVLLLIALAYGAFYLFQKNAWYKSRLDQTVYSPANDRAYTESLLNHNPKPLQDKFVADVEKGVNDKFTKSDAYFLTHRYFDNGGNVYEIYDYVNSHPSLEFLKEAEDIYPAIFDQIRTKTLSPVPYSRNSLYAILAYLEVLDRHGYADIAALGTLANQYAKTAYFIKKRSENDPAGGLDPAPMIRQAAGKAIFFELKTRDMLLEMSTGGSSLVASIASRPTSLNSDLPLVKSLLEIVTAQSLLTGLNQYAACLRYLEATGFAIAIIDSPVPANDVFAFDMLFSKTYVPELEVFTSLLNASTLALVSPQSADAIKAALQPILKYDLTQPLGILRILFEAKDDKFGGWDIYGKKNAVLLASIVPEFKKWLISGGWKETDFR
jgi:hypothetical protein